MATVIDSLVVLLGLDASGYKKGRETAEKETAETARKTREAADSITKSLLDVGKTVAGLFLGFETATGFAKFLGGLNSGEAALGRTAANIGMSAHELNKWGNAVELAGGSAEDAQSAFVQLTNDAQRFFVTGERSQLITTLSQYGVAIKDSSGHLRNQGEIFEELADKTAVYGREYQNFVLKQAGITQGEINYLTLTKEQRQQNLALAERNNAVTDESVAKAAELQQYWRAIGLQIQAAGQMILTAVTPAFEQVLKVFGDLNTQSDEFTAGLKIIGSTAVIIKNLFVGLGDSIGGATAAVAAALRGNFREAWDILKDQSSRTSARNEREAADLEAIWSGQTAAATARTVQNSGNEYVPPAGSKASRYNNPGNILDRSGQERRYASIDAGWEALRDDLTYKMQQRGLRTVDAIITAYEGNDTARNNIPAYITDVRRQLGKNELNESDIPALARAIAAHESGGLQSGPTPAVGGKLTANTAASRTSNTTVSVGTIQVNAPNADPVAVANHVAGAIQRKTSVAMADSGMN